MSVFFSYTTFLQNSYHIANARIAALASSTTQADYYPEWISATLATPSDVAIFFATIDPGHTGTTIAIEYALYVYWHDGSNPMIPDSYIWEIKPSGGAWATLATNASPATTDRDVGIYETGVLLPAQIRLSVTDAAGNVVAKIGDLYQCSARCIGTV